MTDLLSVQNADVVAGVEIISVSALARVLLPNLIEQGLHSARRGGGEAPFIIRPGVAKFADRAKFRELIRTLAIDAIPALPEDAPRDRRYHRALDTVEALADERTDSKAYLSQLIRTIVDRAPRAPQPELDTAATRKRAERTRNDEARRGRPAWTVTERLAASGDRLRDAERNTAHWWIATCMDLDGGTRIAPKDLYEMAFPAMTEVAEDYAAEMAPERGPRRSRLDRWAAIAKADDLPEHPRVPGPRTFYAVADELLRGRHLLRGAHVYVIPSDLKEGDDAL